MKFSREFYFREHPFFFSFSRNGKKVWFYQTKISRMLVFCWYLARKKQLEICLLRIAQFYFRALLVARITQIRAGALRENKTHAKIS